jgi:hypothetical protein
MSSKRQPGRRQTRRQPVTARRQPRRAERPDRWLGAHWKPVAAVAAAVVAIVLLVPFVSGGTQGVTAAIAGPAVHFVGTPSCTPDGTQPYGTTAPSTNAEPAMGQPIDEMPHTHVAPPANVTYSHDPPTSGCHYSLGSGTAPIAPGVYDKHVDPEYWVHNLEHGYIVVLYNCPSGCATDVARLKHWYDGHAPDPALPSEKKIIVIPWETMSTPFAVESWDWFLPLATADTKQIDAFYQNHVDQSPESNQAS